MKKGLLFFSLLIIIIFSGCQDSSMVTTETPFVTYTVTPILTPLPLIANRTSTPTATQLVEPSPTPTSTPVDSPKTQIIQQCLEIIPVPSAEILPNDVMELDREDTSTNSIAFSLPLDEIISSGTLILQSIVSSNPGTFLLDMATGQSIQISAKDENLGYFTLSADRKNVALISVIFNEEGMITKEDLVIFGTNGDRLKTVSWRDEWEYIMLWTDPNHLVFQTFKIDGREINPFGEPAPLSIYNIPTGNQQILLPNFSDFLLNTHYTLPYWDGLFGVAYDPTLSRAIYPRYLEDDEEMYTYAIWDLENDRLVATLEDIFTWDTNYISIAPMPYWSPDGSSFVVIGRVFDKETDEYVEMELYRVSRDGEAEKLTYLNPSYRIHDFNMAWSPDQRYIAILIHGFRDDKRKARLAILDTYSLTIVDTCINVTDYTPIWSPDSNQLITIDRKENVILVDIARGIAVKIAEGMEPYGWLKNE